MQDLATIQRMNNAIESAKIRKRARALNSGGKGHAKDREKGRHLGFGLESVEGNHLGFGLRKVE